MIRNTSLLFSLFFTFCFSTQAQSKFNVDSLIRYVDNYAVQDTNKIKMLISIAVEKRNVDVKNAIGYIEQAIDLSRSLHDSKLEAKAVYTYAMLLSVKGQNKESSEQYLIALKLCEQSKSTKLLGKCYLDLGGNYMYTDAKLSIEYIEKSIAIFEKINSKLELAEAMRKMGTTYAFGGIDVKKGLEYLYKSIQLYEELKYTQGIGGIYNSIGFTYLNESNYPKSLEAYQKALEIDTKHGNLRVMAIDNNGIGRVYLALADYRKAIEYIEKAITLNEQVGNLLSLANSYTYMGIAYDNLADYEKSKIYFEKGLKLNKENKNEANMANSYVNLADSYRNQKNYIKSFEYSQAALDIQRKQLGKRECISLLLSMGKLYTEMSDEELKKIGIAPEEKYTKSIEKLAEGKKLAEEIHEVASIEEALQKISYTYELMQDFPKAYDAYKKYVALKDSVSGDEVKKQITRREIQFEYSKKEDALKYENQLSINQLEKQKLLTTQQRLALNIKEQALLLSNKENDLQHLALLKEKAEKQEKENALNFAEKDKALQATLKNAEISDHRQKSLQLGVVILALVFGLGVSWYYYAQLNKQKNIISAQSKVNENLVSIISHDIKEPLLGVQLLLKKLKINDPYLQQASSSLENQMSTVNDVLNNVLRFQKAGINQSKSYTTGAEVIAVVKKVIQELELPRMKKNIDIQMNLKENPALQVSLLKESLHIVVNNLLSNALKYSYPDTEIIIDQHKNGISIRDFGVGIATDQAILRNEITVSTKGTQDEIGTGLGLYLVAHLIKNTNVKVQLLREEHGTKATIN